MSIKSIWLCQNIRVKLHVAVLLSHFVYHLICPAKIPMPMGQCVPITPDLPSAHMTHL